MTFLFIFISSCNKNPADEDPPNDIEDISLSNFDIINDNDFVIKKPEPLFPRLEN